MEIIANLLSRPKNFIAALISGITAFISIIGTISASAVALKKCIQLIILIHCLKMFLLLFLLKNLLIRALLIGLTHWKKLSDT